MHAYTNSKRPSFIGLLKLKACKGTIKRENIESQLREIVLRSEAKVLSPGVQLIRVNAKNLGVDVTWHFYARSSTIVREIVSEW